MNESIIKRCPMCREPVQDDARKCPHCHHFLNRWTLALYHPAVAMAPLFLMLLVAAYFFTKVFPRGESFEGYRSQVQVAESHMDFGQTSKEETVAVVGTIRNDSPIAWKDVQVEVQYLDAAKKVLDVRSCLGFAIATPPRDSSAFKVSQAREFPKEKYASYTVRVLWARDGRAWP